MPPTDAPTLTTNDIIRDYIAEELLFGQGEAPQDDDNLLTTGLVDSLGIMRLVTFIEEAFGTAVPPEDVIIEHFLTIGHITRYLDGRIHS